MPLPFHKLKCFTAYILMLNSMLTAHYRTVIPRTHHTTHLLFLSAHYFVYPYHINASLNLMD